MRTEPIAPTLRYLYRLNRAIGCTRIQSLINAIINPA